ncbi:uncharacterized protein LOC107018498 [Solanum pennellii]|uniref:Uncharacterized protein LOC107018498 n=1 Tax=Solanum pennellii TaxID=28526 RepID=A0ABM1VB70_SOLPN|nr:uncharacterized protein LOC107018498 [Solanum pennellii]XP_027772989.1 uncharacterized protein LOC107018498 [Solanum pennellii]
MGHKGFTGSISSYKYFNSQFEDYEESNRSGRTMISISGLFVWTLQVEKKHMVGETIYEDIQTLSIVPLIQTKRMTCYICDGVRHLTESRDVKRKTQNSGIMLKAVP